MWKKTRMKKHEATVRASLLQEMIVRNSPFGDTGEVKLIAAILAQGLEDALYLHGLDARVARLWFDSGNAYLWTRLIGLDEDYARLLTKEAARDTLPQDVESIYRNLRRNYG